jgi:hypothetical protein
VVLSGDSALFLPNGACGSFSMPESNVLTYGFLGLAEERLQTSRLLADPSSSLPWNSLPHRVFIPLFTPRHLYQKQN